MDEFTKKYGKQHDHDVRERKRIAREPSKRSAQERSMHGLRAKLYHKKRHAEKIEMKKTYEILFIIFILFYFTLSY